MVGRWVQPEKYYQIIIHKSSEYVIYFKTVQVKKKILKNARRTCIIGEWISCVCLGQGLTVKWLGFLLLLSICFHGKTINSKQNTELYNKELHIYLPIFLCYEWYKVFRSDFLLWWIKLKWTELNISFEIWYYDNREIILLDSIFED